jgi:hypothetical protein
MARGNGWRMGFYAGLDGLGGFDGFDGFDDGAQAALRTA